MSSAHENSINSMSTQRLIGAYFAEAKYEIVRMLRTLSIAVPFLSLPVLIYLLLAAVLFKDALEKDQPSSMFIFAGLMVFGMMGPGIFGFATTVAIEREKGLIKLKRALPMPPAAYLFAKLAMAMLFNLIIAISMIIAAISIGQVRLSPVQILALTIVNVVGALPFSAIGLFLGTIASGSAAPGFANLIYFPMMWLGGLLIPLPKLLQSFAPVWPAYHLAQLSLRVIGANSTGSATLHIMILTGVTLVLGWLSVRRLARFG